MAKNNSRKLTFSKKSTNVAGIKKFQLHNRTNSSVSVADKVYTLSTTKNSWLLIIIMVLLIITLSLGGYVVYLLSSNQAVTTNKNDMIWNPPEDSVKIDSIRVEGATVVITSKCKAIAADTSPERAMALLNALGNRTGERPDIYESMSSVIESFGIKLEGVYVYKVEGDTYYADSYFRIGNKILQLDMKPSDAMSVALRSGSPVYYKQSLFDTMGVRVC